ncbi:MAG TPA: AAA family ATPase, partial [Rudaea sp.]|nr:AAA family ATPase [Rudaea sp.]
MNAPMRHERSIDRTLARWVRERSGSELVARAAYAVSVAEGEGHACAALAADTSFDAAQLRALRGHAWVGDGSTFTPFVCDAKANFYTWRNWQHETCLAKALLERAQARTLPIEANALATDIAELFADEIAQATRWQRVAVAAMPGAHVFVLTGGPGTGKTTVVLRMLLELLHHASACALPDHPAIALAAPTGKAAQRLAQAIAQGKQHLLQKLSAESNFRALIDQIPHNQAQTLHRLLRYRPNDNAFAHGIGNPLAADIVVVDEASMVDLAMMRQLLDALRPDAVLILLGDPAQLAAVEAGCVLGDIVSSVHGDQLPKDLAE